MSRRAETETTPAERSVLQTFDHQRVSTQQADNPSPAQEKAELLNTDTQETLFDRTTAGSHVLTSTLLSRSPDGIKIA
jgi:BRCT domain type II-containing protein